MFQVILRAVVYDEPVGAIFRRRGADVSACPDDAEDVYRRVYRQDLLYVSVAELAAEEAATSFLEAIDDLLALYLGPLRVYQYTARGILD